MRYNLSSLSVNASSVSSVKLVIIWGNLEEKILKAWTVILLSWANLRVKIPSNTYILSNSVQEREILSNSAH